MNASTQIKTLLNEISEGVYEKEEYAVCGFPV